MWNALTYVSTGVSLAAFFAAIGAWIYRYRILQAERLIETAPTNARGPLVERALEVFHVDASKLTRQQRYELAMEQIKRRAARFREAAVVVVIIAVLAAGVAGLSIWNSSGTGAHELKKSDEKSPTVNRADPTATAKAILNAYKQRDFKTVARFGAPEAAAFWEELVQAGSSDPKYRSLVTGWRMEAVQNWDGSIGPVRYFTEENQVKAAVRFHEISADEIAVVTLALSGGEWRFEDINNSSPEEWEGYSKSLPSE